MIIKTKKNDTRYTKTNLENNINKIILIKTQVKDGKTDQAHQVTM